MLTRRRLAAALVVFATPALAQNLEQGSAPSTNLSGLYTVEGRNADGSAYSGTLQLTQNGMDVVGEWRIGADSYRGAGPLEGRILTLHWQPGAAPVIYVVMPNGALYGTWAEGKALERALPR